MNKELNKSLEIQSPHRETIAENQQVYKVILDEDYSVYPEETGGSENDSSSIAILDYRAHYWYTENKKLEELLRRAELDYFRARYLMDILENDGINLSEDDLADKSPKDNESSTDESTEIAKMINAILHWEELGKTRRELYHQLLAEARIDYLHAKDVYDNIQTLQANLMSDMRENGESLESIKTKMVQQHKKSNISDEDTIISSVQKAYDKIQDNRKELHDAWNDKSIITEWKITQMSFFNWFNDNKKKFKTNSIKIKEDETSKVIYFKDQDSPYAFIWEGEDVRKSQKNFKTLLQLDSIGKIKNSTVAMNIFASLTSEEFFQYSKECFDQSIKKNKEALITSITDFNESVANFEKKYLLGSTNPLESVADTLEAKFIYVLQLTGEGWATQDGLPLQEMLKIIDANGNQEKIVVVCPKFDKQGKPIFGVYQAISNPHINRKSLKPLPEISFIENYETAIRWDGYCLGELSYSVNMFPGETKELVVEKATQKTIKSSTKSDRSDASTSKDTSSFEDSLQDELNRQNRVEQDSAQEKQRQHTNNISNELTRAASSKRDFSVSIKGSSGGLGYSVSGKASYGGSNTRSSNDKTN